MTYRKYTEEMLIEAVENSYTFVDTVRYLGISSVDGSVSHITRMIKKFNIDYSHFTHRSMKNNSSNKRLSPEQILIRLADGSSRIKSPLLRRALKELNVEEKCNRCKQAPEWQGKFLRLEINHIDGDWRNCLFENLEFICPNCHSQETETNQPHKNRINL